MPCTQMLGKALHSFTSAARSMTQGRSNTASVPGFAPETCWLSLRTLCALPNALPTCRPAPVLCLLPALRAPRAHTHLYRRAGLTGSPGWRSPAPGDTGWQTLGTQALGTPRMQPPRQPPRSSSRRPSSICRAGRPHTRPQPNAGSTAPGACLHRGTVTGSPPATLHLLPHGRYDLPQQHLSEMPSPVGTLQGE